MSLSASPGALTPRCSSRRKRSLPNVTASSSSPPGLRFNRASTQDGMSRRSTAASQRSQNSSSSSSSSFSRRFLRTPSSRCRGLRSLASRSDRTAPRQVPQNRRCPSSVRSDLLKDSPKPSSRLRSALALSSAAATARSGEAVSSDARRASASVSGAGLEKASRSGRASRFKSAAAPAKAKPPTRTPSTATSREPSDGGGSADA
mmetsp:Transcript_17073/g.53209  ORF Transcript_17073/g.53209 Transcript_17073/m.53209 type:complete len:204 (+) Transcript_17073:407-1018(+)